VALEFVLDLVIVEDLDFGDEPVEAQTHRGVRDVVGGGEVLEGAGKEDEPLDEGEVFVLEKIDPALRIGLRVVHGFIEMYLRFNLNKIKININYIKFYGRFA